MTDEKLADVNLCCGRFVLYVAGLAIAMEGDMCRELLPEEVCEPIPEAELDCGTIGGEPIRNMPREVVRYFRGDRWTRDGLLWAAEKINNAVDSRLREASFK